MGAKKKSPVRIVRAVLAVVSILVMTVLFASAAAGKMFGFLAKAQFVPALLAVNAAVLVLLLLLVLVGGRLYCSVICPLGILQDFVNWLTVRIGGKKKSMRFGYSRPHNVLRYSVLAIFVVALIAGAGSVFALLDPYAAFGRIMTDIFRPVSICINNLLAGIWSDAFMMENQYVGLNALALSIASVTFIAVVWTAVRKGRLYCNAFCPVGTIWGLLGRFSLFRININTALCNGCGVCALKCRGGCIDAKKHKVDYSRCIDCFDCLDNCRQGAISYSVKRKKNVMKDGDGAEDQSRRKFLSALAMAGLIGSKSWAREKVEKVEGLVSGTTRSEAEKPLAVSPFGSMSHKHLNSNCSACHLCIDKCPRKVLRPAVSEYGFDGIMQPVLDYNIGYCDYDCTLCGQVCPSGAIKPLSADEKQSTKVGLAVVSLEDCVISKGTLSCGRCARECPADAIRLVPDYNAPLTDVEIEQVEEMPAEVRPHIHFRIYPKVEPELCIGCGACQFHCPGKAITVHGFAEHK